MSDLRFHLKQGDQEPALQVIIYNPDTTPMNLSAVAGILFRMSKPGEAPTIAAGSTTGVDLVNGIVEYRWGPDDTDEAGEYRAEFIVTYTSGKEETFPKDTYLIVEIHENV